MGPRGAFPAPQSAVDSSTAFQKDPRLLYISRGPSRTLPHSILYFFSRYTPRFPPHLVYLEYPSSSKSTIALSVTPTRYSCIPPPNLVEELAIPFDSLLGERNDLLWSMRPLQGLLSVEMWLMSWKGTSCGGTHHMKQDYGGKRSVY